jgi:hypothetical protein
MTDYSVLKNSIKLGKQVSSSDDDDAAGADDDYVEDEE